MRLKQPKRDRLTFGDDPVFPSDHMKRLIAAARAGETTLSIKVFDGSDDGRKVYDTLAVIGRQHRARPGGGGRGGAADSRRCSKLARWPVTLSYFTAGRGEQTPVYMISFELYENGVSRALKLDYGEFALKGDVAQFELKASDKRLSALRAEGEATLDGGLAELLAQTVDRRLALWRRAPPRCRRGRRGRPRRRRTGRRRRCR